jgi:hypothetical protein
MNRIASAALVGLLSLTASSPEWSIPRAFSMIRAGLAAPATPVTPPAGHEWQKVLWRIDFSDYAGGSIEEWLQAKGFRLEQGAEDPELLALSSHEGALMVEAKAPVKGFLVKRDVHLEEVSKVRIHWGIINYPEDASYERRVNNEALMLYIFFGQDTVASGHVMIPALPYLSASSWDKRSHPTPRTRGDIFTRAGGLCVSEIPTHMKR